MSLDTTRLVFFAIVSVMWLIWYVGTRFALGRIKPPNAKPSQPGDIPDPETANVITGEATVSGETEALSKKLAEQLLETTGRAGVSPIKIVERTSARIVFECEGGAATYSRERHSALAFDSGLITLEPEGDRVRVRYAANLGRTMRTIGILTRVVCFGYGALIMLVVPALVWVFVVNSEREATRWQVFQTLQMAHGVWPPFLVGGLGGMMLRTTVRFFDTLVSNVEHLV